MTKQVELYYDFGSPTAYLAYKKLRMLEQEGKLELVYRPMLLGAVFKETGNRPPAMVPAKGKFLFTDIMRYAQRYGVDYTFNPHFPINTLMLMRATVAMQENQRFIEFNDTCFHSIWRDEKNMNDPEVAAAVFNEAGFPIQEIVALTADPKVKEQLKNQTSQAIDRGVFGAPTMFFENEMYWGQDRIFMIEEAL